VFVLASALYASLLPRLYTSDDLQYAATIRTAVTGQPVYHPVGGPPFPAPTQRPDVPVNPRYALDWPTSVGMVRVARALGRHDEIDAILVGRVLMGAIGVTFFFMTVLLIAGRRLVAALAAVALATSSVYWTYSTHLDESIGMMAFTCAALYFLVRRILSGPSRYDLVVPLLLGVASLYNLTTIVTAVPAALVWPMGMGAESVRGRLRSLAGFALTYAGAAVLGVVGALLATGSGSNILKTAFWRSSLFVGRPEYAFRPFHDGFDAGASFLRGLVAYPPVRGLTTLRDYFTISSTGPRLAALLYYAVVGLLALAPFVLLLRTRPWNDRLRRLIGFAVAWFATSLVFAWWWDPSYVKYFLLPVLSWCLLLALALTQLRVQSRSGGAVLALTSVVVLALFALNLSTTFLPQRTEGANQWLTAARKLKHSKPGSLFVSAGRHPLDFYVAYFAGRDVISSGLIRYASGSDADVAQVVKERVRQHARLGGPIYVYGLDTVTPSERRLLLHLLPGTGLRPVWRLPALTVYLRPAG
jgi:MFS family permease